MEPGEHAKTYRHAAMSANNRDIDERNEREVSDYFSDKSSSTDNVQGGDAKQPKSRISFGEQTIDAIECGAFDDTS